MARASGNDRRRGRIPTTAKIVVAAMLPQKVVSAYRWGWTYHRTTRCIRQSAGDDRAHFTQRVKAVGGDGPRSIKSMSCRSSISTRIRVASQRQQSVRCRPTRWARDIGHPRAVKWPVCAAPARGIADLHRRTQLWSPLDMPVLWSGNAWPAIAALLGQDHQRAMSARSSSHELALRFHETD